MKKTTRKTLAMLLAALLVIGCIPLMGISALAAERDALDAAIDALVDAHNLRFYTDEAILSVADALGGGYTDAQAFLDAVNAGGYQYVGENSAEAMQASVEALQALMAKGAAMTPQSLGYVVPDGLRGKAIHRDESKASADLRIVPVLYNGALMDSPDELVALKGGDRITFAVELETNYPVSVAELPIVFDSTKFHLVNTDGYVFCYDGEGTDDVQNIRNADASYIVDTSALRAKIKNNYTVECYTVSSPQTQYPLTYQIPEYTQQYKVLLIEVQPKISSRTVPQVFTDAYSRLCTFTLQTRDDVPFDGSVQGVVGTPADWFSSNEHPENLFAVTRATGNRADGSVAANGTTDARWAFDVYDIYAQYGQTASAHPATVLFDASGCRHSFVLVGETERSLQYRCTKCGAEKEELKPDPHESILRLSTHTVKAGRDVDVTVTMENNPGIVAMRFGLEYDPSVLELREVVDGGLLGEKTLTIGEFFDASPFWVLWADAQTKENYTADGTLITYRFHVRDDAPSGETTLKLHFRNSDTFNTQLQEQPFTVVDSVILVGAYFAGDADLDGILTVKDAVVIRRYLVASLKEDALDMENADFNADGTVNLKDVVLILRQLVDA